MLFRFLKRKLILGFVFSFSILSLNISYASASNDDRYTKSESCEVLEGVESDSSLSISGGTSLTSKSVDTSKKLEEAKKEKQSDGEDSECINLDPNPIKISKKAPKFSLPPTISTCGVNTNLNWNVATTRYNSPVDVYKIRYSSDNGVTWIIHPITTNSTSITISSLVSGLTYIYQVSAHNQYGWGPWSPISVACAISSGISNTYAFSISIPNPGPTNLLPDMVLDYSSDGINAVQTGSFSVPTAETGVLSKGKYLHDIYITLKKGAVQRTFTINGNPGTASAYFPDSLNMGANNPIPLMDVGFFYTGSETYAFDIPQGATTISVIITN